MTATAQALERAIADYDGPLQLYDLQRLEANIEAVGRAIGASEHVLFPVKSFPAEEVLARALPERAVVVVSTDLSHYHDAETARRLDARTAETVEALAVDELGYEDACGADALRVSMAWAQAMGWRIRALDLRNSADTAGDPARVVGYGAFVIEG